MTETERNIQTESPTTQLRKKINNSSLMKHHSPDARPTCQVQLRSLVSPGKHNISGSLDNIDIEYDVSSLIENDPHQMELE